MAMTLNNDVMIGENSIARYFLIHKVWQMPMMCNSLYNPRDNVIFEFSCITKLGEIYDNKNYIAGKSLHSILMTCNLKKGPFFVFDKIHTNMM